METTRMRRSTYENIHPSTPFTPPPGVVPWGENVASRILGGGGWAS
ncbi:MAG: hypothetical protein QW238_00255 [Candidatus Bathyarchaeia archaeon]